MIDPRLSSATKELVRLARVDGPSAAARAKVWAGVSGAVGGAAAGGAAAANGATAGGAGVAKMLTIGTLLGAPLTVGLAVTLLYVGAMPQPHPGFGGSSTPQHPGFGVSSTPPKPPNVEVVSARVDERSGGWMPASTPLTAASTRIVVSTRAGHPKPLPEAKAAATKAVRAPAHGDALAREAAFVAEAHAALLHGDPNGALRAIASARAMAAPQLVPEELAVEGQALRALGRTDEANANDVALRLLYPESALAR